MRLYVARPLFLGNNQEIMREGEGDRERERKKKKERKKERKKEKKRTT